MGSLRDCTGISGLPAYRVVELERREGRLGKAFPGEGPQRLLSDSRRARQAGVSRRDFGMPGQGPSPTRRSNSLTTSLADSPSEPHGHAQACPDDSGASARQVLKSSIFPAFLHGACFAVEGLSVTACEPVTVLTTRCVNGRPRHERSLERWRGGSYRHVKLLRATRSSDLTTLNEGTEVRMKTLLEEDPSELMGLEEGNDPTELAGSEDDEEEPREMMGWGEEDDDDEEFDLDSEEEEEPLEMAGLEEEDDEEDEGEEAPQYGRQRVPALRLAQGLRAKRRARLIGVAALRARRRSRLLALAVARRRRRARLLALVALRARRRTRILEVAALRARKKARTLAVAAVRARRRIRLLKRAAAGAGLRASA